MLTLLELHYEDVNVEKHKRSKTVFGSVAFAHRKKLNQKMTLPKRVKEIMRCSKDEVNIIKLESYTPDGRMVATQFHIDVEAHPHDQHMMLAMDELNYFAKDIRMLGTYQASDYRDQST